MVLARLQLETCPSFRPNSLMSEQAVWSISKIIFICQLSPLMGCSYAMRKIFQRLLYAILFQRLLYAILFQRRSICHVIPETFYMPYYSRDFYMPYYSRDVLYAMLFQRRSICHVIPETFYMPYYSAFIKHKGDPEVLSCVHCALIYCV